MSAAHTHTNVLMQTFVHMHTETIHEKYTEYQDDHI